MSVRALALRARRLGRVFASAATWTELIRERGWRRPRTRIHPPSPKQGVRATKPNECWHIDVTIIRLLDGPRVYLHAAIYNFSRRILAWKLALRRVLAQVEVTFSNSMIEAFWRSLRHRWLFLNRLESFAAVERLVAFYVEQHSSVIPHAAFQGHTPDEVYFGTNRDLFDKLRATNADTCTFRPFRASSAPGGPRSAS